MYATQLSSKTRESQNVAAFVKDNNVDGADFDWEYLEASDTPDILAGSLENESNYLDFLKTIKPLLPAGTTISIAAPASFWYLWGFPVADMGCRLHCLRLAGVGYLE